MAAVTQSITTFLGGVSRQADTKKQAGQVSDIINGYPDPTYGLLKRNSTQFLGELASYVDDNSDTLKDGYWFSISRDNDERYLGVITPSGNLRIWNTVPQNVGGVLSFTEATITNKNDADVVSYLTPTGSTAVDQFHTFSYLDQSYIINKSKTVQMTAKTDYYLRTRATVILGGIDYDQEYSIWIDGTKCSFTTITLSAAEARGKAVDSDEILTGLKAALDATVGTNYNTFKYSSSLEIERKDGQTPFTIEVKGGVQGVSLTSYQDEISSSSRLAAYTKPGRRVKIINSVDERASYFVQFVATGNVYGDTTTAVNSGSGYWEEARGWDIDLTQSGIPVSTGGKFIAKLASTGFNAETMPYKLVNTATNQFTISKEAWAPRLTGNDYGNPVPSFVDRSIKFGLVYSNRLVFLTTDTIAMSVAKDFENFFFTSAQTILASDPVDVETTSSKVSNLYCAVPQAQGLVIFSEYEQYLLYSESGVISPNDIIIRTISQYESDRTIPAKDSGDFITFVSKAAGYSRVFGMQPRGNLESAEVADISKVVAGYIPADIGNLIVNTQDSLLALYSKASNDVYLYKYFNNGREQLMQAWFRWSVPGKLQTMTMVDNFIVMLVREAGQYRVITTDLIQDSDPGVTTLGWKSGRLDHSFVVGAAGTITYNSVTNKSTIPIPYNDLTSYAPLVLTIPPVVVGPSTDYNTLYQESGNPTTTSNYIMEVERAENGDWLVEGDWTGKEFELLAGYRFNFDVLLPRYFYREDREKGFDWTSSLTIARMKFDVGFSGSMNFFINRFGSTEWKSTVGVQYANYYISDSSPTVDRTVLTVPIHQKNTNYTLKINSDAPFPVSLNSMTWEGNYAPRYYRRA